MKIEYSPVMMKMFMSKDNDLLFYLVKKLLRQMEDERYYLISRGVDDDGALIYRCRICGFAPPQGEGHLPDCVYLELKQLVDKLEGQNG